jgi:hypothetical protein
MPKRKEMRFLPLKKPLIINAISCRLSGDLQFNEPHHIPREEMQLILGILDAAVALSREIDPDETDKFDGYGTKARRKKAEAALVSAVRRDIDYPNVEIES